jgi:mannosyltransferase
MIKSGNIITSTISKSKSKTGLRTLYSLIIIILLGSLLRFYKLGARDFWFDEAFSVRDVRSILLLPPDANSNLLPFTTDERLPPLFFYLLIPFYVISPSESVLRIVSAVSGIASIPVMYYLGAKLFNNKLGLVGALLLALSPFAIYYSQELRPYSLFLFFSILAFYLTLLALEKGKNRYFLGLTVTLVLGFYTHYFMVFTIFIINIYYLLCWKTNRPLLLKWFFSHLALAILCIPALYQVFYHISKGDTNLGEFPPGLRSLAGTFYLFTMGRVFLSSRENLIFILVQGVLWGGGLILGMRALWKSARKYPNYQPASLFLASGIIFCIIWLVSLILIPLFDEARIQYLIFFLPLYILLITKGWGYIQNPKIKFALIGLALVLNLVSLYPYYFSWDQVGKGNFRAAAKYVKNSLQVNDVVYHTTQFSTVPFEYYFDWKVPQVDLSVSDPSEYMNNNRFWLVVFEHQGGVDFSFSSLGIKNLPSASPVNLATTCQQVITDPKYSIVEYKVFPGKTELIVCLYHKSR